MPIPSPSRALRRLILPLLFLSCAPAALAQAPGAAPAPSAAHSDDPAELLAQALRTLAVEPNNLEALRTAGHNALALGDPNAAVGFFGRAQGINPNDGQVKAGLGSALVQLEKPQEALRLFGEASRLGVPDLDIARDRGLAYDLMGDNRRAQRDYALVLAAHPDDELDRRRLALSQAISGDRAAAIATLDPLIRKRDVAGWRAQTFVLAMTGDAKGASDITHIMLPTQADALQPFLVRLATLTPAQKARAVHFGEMPEGHASHSPAEVAQAEAPATYAAPRSDLAPVPTVSPARPAASSPASAAGAPLAGLATRTPAPAASYPGLPTPAAEGHYDLPHVAADRHASARAPAASASVGTPVVHGRAEETESRASRAHDAALIAAAADIECAPAGDHSRHGTSRHGKAGTHAHHERTCTAAETRKKAAAAKAEAQEAHADDDCTTIRVAGTSHHGRKGKPTSKTVCKAAGSTDGDSRLSAGQRASADEDCTTIRVAGTTHHGRKGKATTKRVCKADDSADGASKATADKGSGADEDCTTVRVAGTTHHGRKGKATTKRVCKADESSDSDTKATRGTSAADDADCTRVKSAGTAHHGRKGKAVGKTVCKSDDADDDKATPASAKERDAAADREGDCGEAAKAGSHGKAGRGRTARSHAKASPRCASAEEEGDDAKAKRGTSGATHGSGVYVQVAGGANKADLDKAWAGVKKKAPELMRGKTPTTTPLHATNRLLVGPFKDEAEAQAFVNKMSAKGLSGFVFKSSKGQKVDKVDSDQ